MIAQQALAAKAASTAADQTSKVRPHTEGREGCVGIALAQIRPRRKPSKHSRTRLQFTPVNAELICLGLVLEMTTTGRLGFSFAKCRAHASHTLRGLLAERHRRPFLSFKFSTTWTLLDKMVLI